MAHGVAIVGSLDTVRRRLLDHHRQLGFDNHVALMQFSTLSCELTEKSIRLFAREVLPARQAAGDEDYAGFDLAAHKAGHAVA